MSFDHQAFPDSTSLEHVASVNQLEQDRALFVGAKYESYYQAQSEKSRKRNNMQALILPPFS